MDGLGRVFNVLQVADDVYVSLKDASAVTFVGYLTTTDTYTLTEANDTGGGGSQVLPTMDHYYAQTTVGAVWARVNQAAGSTIVSGTPDVIAVTIHESELSDGKSAVKLTSTGAGLVFAILHDLKVQRAPANLKSLV
jgi:hypothetical protein